MNKHLLSSTAVLYLQEQDIEDIGDSPRMFGQMIEDTEDVFSIQHVGISKDAWEEMGEPTTITVTIVSGDTLNV